MSESDLVPKSKGLLPDGTNPDGLGSGSLAAAGGFFGDGEGFGGFHGLGGTGDEENEFSFGVRAQGERWNRLAAWRFWNQPELQRARAGRCGNV